MINLLFNTKTVNYSSNLNGDNLKQKIETIFKDRNLSFVGKFTSQNEFETYDKWTYIKWYVPNFKRRTAYLYGKLIKSGKETLISVNIKPNPVVAVVPLIILLVGIIITIIARSSNESLVFGIIIVAIGVLYYLLGMFFTNRLRKNFGKYLDLQQV